MGFYGLYLKYKTMSKGLFGRVSAAALERSLRSDIQNPADLAALLSPLAESRLEWMAQRSHEITARYFGRTIQLYTPLYLSNYCDNECVYCGFNAGNDIERKALTPGEVEREARYIAAKGLRHILLLTGGSRRMSPPGYIKECVGVLTGIFSSIAIEIYPLTDGEYAELVSGGVDGLTIYQELYNETIYKEMHPKGPKGDYLFRLDAPERGARNGMRSVNIGVLLGLGDWRREAFFLGLHARYLQDRFPDVEIGISVPRLRPQTGNFRPPYEVSDRNVVQLITALRIFMPRIGITISTREDPRFREDLLPLGVTRMSAGSTTKVGGHTIDPGPDSGSSQFELLDHRNAEEVRAMLEKRGYQPVFKDWMRI